MINKPKADNLYRLETFVTIILTGFNENPEEITKLIGVSPTSTGLKGEPNPALKNVRLVNRENLWHLDSSLPKERTLQDHINSLIKILQPHQESFLAIAKTCEAELYIATYFDFATPTITIPPQTLSQLSRYGLGERLDLFFVGAEVATT